MPARTTENSLTPQGNSDAGPKGNIKIGYTDSGRVIGFNHNAQLVGMGIRVRGSEPGQRGSVLITGAEISASGALDTRQFHEKIIIKDVLTVSEIGEEGNRTPVHPVVRSEVGQLLIPGGSEVEKADLEWGRRNRAFEIGVSGQLLGFARTDENNNLVSQGHGLEFHGTASLQRSEIASSIQVEGKGKGPLAVGLGQRNGDGQTPNYVQVSHGGGPFEIDARTREQYSGLNFGLGGTLAGGRFYRNRGQFSENPALVGLASINLGFSIRSHSTETAISVKTGPNSRLEDLRTPVTQLSLMQG